MIRKKRGGENDGETKKGKIGNWGRGKMLLEKKSQDIKEADSDRIGHEEICGGTTNSNLADLLC